MVIINLNAHEIRREDPALISGEVLQQYRRGLIRKDEVVSFQTGR